MTARKAAESNAVVTLKTGHNLVDRFASMATVCVQAIPIALPLIGLAKTARPPVGLVKHASRTRSSPQIGQIGQTVKADQTGL